MLLDRLNHMLRDTVLGRHLAEQLIVPRRPIAAGLFVQTLRQVVRECASAGSGLAAECSLAPVGMTSGGSAAGRRSSKTSRSIARNPRTLLRIRTVRVHSGHDRAGWNGVIRWGARWVDGFGRRSERANAG